jgi:hypothetical protein
VVRVSRLVWVSVGAGAAAVLFIAVGYGAGLVGRPGPSSSAVICYNTKQGSGLRVLVGGGSACQARETALNVSTSGPVVWRSSSPLSFVSAPEECSVRQTPGIQVTATPIGVVQVYVTLTARATPNGPDKNGVKVSLYEPTTGRCYDIGDIDPPFAGTVLFWSVLNLTPGVHTLQPAFRNFSKTPPSSNVTISATQIVAVSL